MQAWWKPWIASVGLMFGWGLGFAQEPPEEDDEETKPKKVERASIDLDNSILNDPPFDIITTKELQGGDVVRVFAIDLPNRKIPEQPDPKDTLIVTMLKYPGRKYKVMWRDIESIQLYENLVMQDCRKLMAAKEYAAAFEHLNYLLNNHPRMPKLNELYEQFLETSAREMFAQNRTEHSLAVLEEFQRAFPNSKTEGIRRAISEFADRLISKYVADGDLRPAQKMLERLRLTYSPMLAVVEKWDKEFKKRANQHRDSALELRDEGKLKEARREAVQMLALAPKIEGGEELLDELIKAYPMVRVGVFLRSDKPDPTSLTDWASRRSGMLISEPLFEFRNTGTEGGDYRFTQGKYTQSDDRRELGLEFRANEVLHPVSPLDVSQWILRRADPKSSEYRAGWASVFSEIAQDGPTRLVLKLRKPHVLPHALLQWQIREMYGEDLPTQVGSYKFSKLVDNELSYIWAGEVKPTSNQPVEIVERLYEDPRKAVNDMIRGDLEVIDQLYPADAKRLAGIDGVKVGSYALPSVHMLVPRSDHRFLQETEFRRALMYAIDRNGVLRNEILGNEGDAQSQLISGPFPRGKSENDKLSYAYNTNIDPMPFDQRLAKVLVMLTERKLADMAAKKKQEPPKMEEIRLGVPDSEAAKTAGEAFVQQWNLVQIPARLVVLPKGQSDARDGSIDLLYVAAGIWEPATDAERIFGVDGFAPTSNPYIVQAISQLKFARNWVEVRRSLQDLHTLVDSHLPILPLWQVTDFFATRSYLNGFATEPMSLYQDMERWRLGK